MKQYSTIILMLLFCTLGFGQNDSSNNNEVADSEYRPAEFINGGHEGLDKFIFENLRVPQEALDANISGVIKVTFVVDKEGNIQNVNIVGEGLGYGLNEEAIRVIKLTDGLWRPCIHQGTIVPVRFTLPIRIKIEEISRKKKNKRKK